MFHSSPNHLNKIQAIINQVWNMYKPFIFRVISNFWKLVELCRQEPHELETRLRAATAEAICSITSIQGASVAQLPRAFGDIEHPLEPLPLLNWQNNGLLDIVNRTWTGKEMSPRWGVRSWSRSRATSHGPTSASRPIVPIGKKPLALFGHRV